MIDWHKPAVYHDGRLIIREKLMQHRFIALIGLFIALTPLAAMADEAHFEVELSLGALVGDSTYEIGGTSLSTRTGAQAYDFPCSRLEFPSTGDGKRVARLNLMNTSESRQPGRQRPRQHPEGLGLALTRLARPLSGKRLRPAHPAGRKRSALRFQQTHLRLCDRHRQLSRGQLASQPERGLKVPHFKYECDNLNQTSPPAGW